MLSILCLLMCTLMLLSLKYFERQRCEPKFTQKMIISPQFRSQYPITKTFVVINLHKYLQVISNHHIFFRPNFQSPSNFSSPITMHFFKHSPRSNPQNMPTFLYRNVNRWCTRIATNHVFHCFHMYTIMSHSASGGDI